MSSGSSLAREEELSLAETTLESFGIKKPPDGWSESELVESIANQGWRYTCTGTRGDWTVSISKRDGDATCETLSGDDDRVIALVVALALALQDSEKL